MTDKVRYEVGDAVATVTIARPEKRNAMDRDVFAGLYEAGRRAGADAQVRAVVVTGEGPMFSSGIDTTIFSDRPPGSPATFDIAALQRAFTVYEEISKPVIAAVAGAAFGAGFQLAIACDLRVAADDATFSLMEVAWGIIPDLGGTVRLPRLVGTGRAKELAFTARKVGAEEANAWGLVNRTVPAGEHVKAATEWARELAAGPPLALAGMKRLVTSAFDHEIATGLEREATVQRSMLSSQDFIEAVTAKMQKRAPVFQAR
jgi:2-(1,2-epoxy-1,2-dihydrophenyl)acetyl-CoA isomerase